MPSQFEVVKTDQQLGVELNKFRNLEDGSVDAVLCELGGGLLRFTGVVFTDAKPDNLLVQKFKREPEGRGPHFDLYADYLDEKYPWVALLNLSGVANISTVPLPQDIADVYFSRYSGPSDEAFDARRPLSKFSLNAPGAEVKTGKLEAGTGLLLPQREAGPHIVHDVVPAGSVPGEFIKAVVAKDDAIEFLNEKGYATLDDFTTESAGGKKAATRSLGEAVRAVTLPRTLRTPTYDDEPYRHNCNLD